MSDEMNYCDRCGKLVPPADAKSGKASVGDDGSLCAACVSAGPDAGKPGMPAKTKILIGSIGGGVLLAVLVLAFMGGKKEIAAPPPPPRKSPRSRSLRLRPPPWRPRPPLQRLRSRSTRERRPFARGLTICWT